MTALQQPSNDFKTKNLRFIMNVRKNKYVQLATKIWILLVNQLDTKSKVEII